MTTTATQNPTIVRVIRQFFPSTGRYLGWAGEETVYDSDSETFSAEVISPDGLVGETIQFRSGDAEWQKGAVETVALRRALAIEVSGQPVVLEFEGYDN